MSSQSIFNIGEKRDIANIGRSEHIGILMCEKGMGEMSEEWRYLIIRQGGKRKSIERFCHFCGCTEERPAEE